jgi:hypothetical protein
MAGLRKPVPPTQNVQADWEDMIDYLGGITGDARIDVTKILLSQGGSLLSTWRKSTDLNKIDGAKISDGTLLNAAIVAAAGIPYSKLNLTTSIVNGDIAAGAAIAKSKISTSGIWSSADVGMPATIDYDGMPLPLVTRIFGIPALAYYDGTYFVCRARTGANVAKRINASLSPLATTNIGEYWGGLYVLLDAVNNSIEGSVPVPTDWVSGTDIIIELWLVAKASGNMYFRYYLRSRADAGSGINWDVDTADQTLALTQDVLKNLQLTLAAANITAGELLEFRLRRYGEHASDTVNADVMVRGASVSYTAADPVDGSSSLFSLYNLYDYGTYEWKAKMAGPGTGKSQWVGIFEKTHGSGSAGQIGVACIDGIYYLQTRDDAGVAESTVIAAQDWTSEKTFKIIWHVDHVTLYIDDVEKANNTTRVPTGNMQLFFEASRVGGASATDSDVYFKENSFREIV